MLTAVDRLRVICAAAQTCSRQQWAAITEADRETILGDLQAAAELSGIARCTPEPKLHIVWGYVGLHYGLRAATLQVSTGIITAECPCGVHAVVFRPPSRY